MVLTLKVDIKILSIIIGLLILVSLLALWLKPETMSFNSSDMEFIVVVDPGHGSIDTGTSHGDIYEKDINLKIGKLLDRELKKVNIRSIMTRTEDKLYLDSRSKDIQYRPGVAEENQADLFISIHANNFPSSQPSGSQIFYKPGSSASKKLAEYIKTKLVKLRSQNDRSIKSGDYYVLNQAPCPAILIEVGFLSNPADRKMLTSPEYQQSLAAAIQEGTINYFQDLLGNDIPDISIENQTEKEVIQTRTLYYVKADNNNNNISLVRKNLSYPAGSLLLDKYQSLKFNERLARIALDQLLNPPQGLISPLPDETGIRSLKIKDNILSVDFSSEIRNRFNNGAGMEEYAVKAITRTLFSIPGIQGIEILIEGEKGQSIGGHILLNKVFKPEE